MNEILKLAGVHKDFNGLQVLNAVELSIADGERHAIIGPNGAGKTTLTNLITGKYPLSKGSLWFRGQRIDGLKPYQRVRLGIGRSFQIINVFRDMTVFENIRNAVLSRHGIRLNMFRSVAGNRKVADETHEIVELVGLTADSDRLAATLPYGAQRALEIGLALAQRPQLVILDEPAAGLSAAETRDVTELIRRTMQGRTLVFIEHDMDVVFALADRISVLHHGRVLVQGSPDEIRKNDEVRRVYLGYREA
jgi:branched-chain amino acid transport system ATP-binding protein